MPITLPIPNSSSGSGFANNNSTYYNNTNQGEFQFITLEEIIKNFTATYVGEGKILENVLTGDISFHAHRALQELHYDTLKSCKSLEVEVCGNLKVPLPNDYVNYSKIAWVDANGIWRNLYPTSKTGNPFAVEQNSDNCVDCGDTSDTYTYSGANLAEQEIECSEGTTTCSASFNPRIAGAGVDSEVLGFDQTLVGILKAMNCSGEPLHYLNFSQRADYFNQFFGAINDWCSCLEVSGADYNCGTFLPYQTTEDGNGTQFTNIGEFWAAFSFDPSEAYIYNFIQAPTDAEFLYSQFMAGPPSTPSSYDGVGISSNLWGANGFNGIYGPFDQLPGDITDLPSIATTLTGSSPSSNSWDNYKGSTSTSVALDTSLTTSPAVDADTYYNSVGARRGLDPQYAQANGTYFIDCRNGMIHFSSNIAGKTIVIEYISDGHGTDQELIIHKFAEEAMYKWIAYGCAQARADVDPGTIARIKQERFAETRKAKIRLSNIKIEEISQVFRGKSKFIKH